MTGPDEEHAAKPAEHPIGNGAEETERELEAEIEGLRGELDGMVDELDRRRHEAFDVRLQLRRHAGLVAAVGAGALLLTVFGIAAWTSSRRRQDLLHVRLQNLGRAVALMARHPDRLQRALERKPDPGTAIASAVANVAGAVGKRMILGAR
jgi:hypothetical protein